MFKALVFGFSATVNMVLIGAGGLVVGAGALKAAQKLSEKREPTRTLVRTPEEDRRA